MSKKKSKKKLTALQKRKKKEQAKKELAKYTTEQKKKLLKDALNIPKKEIQKKPQKSNRRDKSTELISFSKGKRYVNQKRINDFIDSMSSIADKADAQALIENWMEEYPDRTLTKRGLASRVSTSKINKLLINAGYTIEEAADELGVSEDELLNESNWEFGRDHNGRTIFTLNGISYKYIFNYTGSIFERM